MNYREAIERQISGETDEVNRRKKLWREICTAHEKGGEDMIKLGLTTHTDKIAKRFEEFLKQLRKTL